MAEPWLVRNKKAIAFCFLSLWICTFFIQDSSNGHYKIPQPYRQNSLGNQHEELKHLLDEELLEQKQKKILFYTSYFHLTDWQFGFGHQPFLDFGCPVSNCFTTKDHHLLGSLSDFDAILFHIRDMQDGHIPLPRMRLPNQYYVMFLMESPLNDNFPYEKFQNFFNWTMTYRRDSDIHRPYGWVAPKNWTWHYAASADATINWSQYPIRSDVSSIKSKKRKLVAWLVSNCHTHSQREHYVRNLSKYIQVDTFGHCGDHQCPGKDVQCSQYIQEEYMFYLSFENSICQDYVTEKFWSYLQGQLVPIVLGGADYDKIAPPHSFINAMNFPNPKDLANHLHYLVNNQTAYQEYFRWVPDFTVYPNNDTNYARAMCQLCEKLHLNEPKVYQDINEYWRIGGQCQTQVPWGVSTFQKKIEAWKDVMVDSASNIISSLG